MHGNGTTRTNKRLHEIELFDKATKKWKGNENEDALRDKLRQFLVKAVPFDQQLKESKDKDVVIVDIGLQEWLYAEAINLALLLRAPEQPGSLELLDMLRRANDYDPARFDEDVYRFPECFDEMLPEISDESVVRRVQHLKLVVDDDPSKAKRFAPPLGKVLKGCKRFQHMDSKAKVDLLRNFPPEVLADMSGVEEPENMSDHEKTVRSIHFFCPTDQDILNELINIVTDPEEKRKYLKEKGKFLLERSDFESFGKHVCEHPNVNFADDLTLDQCDTLKRQVEAMTRLFGDVRPLHRTLAAAFHQLRKPFEALDHMDHCLNLMEHALKEEIMVKHQIELRKQMSAPAPAPAAAPAPAPAPPPGDPFPDFTGNSWQEFMRFRYEQHRANPIGAPPTKEELGVEWKDLKAKRGLT
jgi:hypothetical protein